MNYSYLCITSFLERNQRLKKLILPTFKSEFLAFFEKWFYQVLIFSFGFWVCLFFSHLPCPAWLLFQFIIHTKYLRKSLCWLQISDFFSGSSNFSGVFGKSAFYLLCWAKRKIIRKEIAVHMTCLHYQVTSLRQPSQITPGWGYTGENSESWTPSPALSTHKLTEPLLHLVHSSSKGLHGLKFCFLNISFSKVKELFSIHFSSCIQEQRSMTSVMFLDTNCFNVEAVWV